MLGQYRVSGTAVREEAHAYIIKDLQSLSRKGDAYNVSHSKTAALVTTSHNLLIPINF